MRLWGLNKTDEMDIGTDSIVACLARDVASARNVCMVEDFHSAYTRHIASKSTRTSDQT